jgi:hypothetical protein
MSGMKNTARLLILIVAGIPGFAALASAQDGSVRFAARVTPTGGLEEPVRGFPFYLLRKSFEEIGKEVEAAEPKPDQDAFISKLDLSPELKKWMKKNNCISLTGEDFVHKLNPADIMNVPEFYAAYLDRNAGDQSVDFPKPKFKASDRVKNPAKYEKLSAEYREEIRRYIKQHPQSISEIELNFTEIDPRTKWNDLVGKRAPEIHRQTLALARSTYLVAQTQTNLEGQGLLRGIPPGTYWLSTLDVAATVGDERLRWDVRVAVRPGDTNHIVLSNFNSVRPSAASP